MIDIAGKETAEYRSGSAYHRSGHRAILPFMVKLSWNFALVCFIGGAGVAESAYVLVLKNGRAITVQSYREKGSMKNFSALGGKIGLPKIQIKKF